MPVKERKGSAKVAVSKVSPICCDIKIELPQSGYKTWEQWVLLTSCRHFDHPDSDRTAQRDHLDEASARSAGVIDVGDFLCLMQTPGDKRAGVGGSGVRRAHNPGETGQPFINSVLDEAESELKDYKDLFWMVGSGNHETAFYRKCGLDVTPLLASRLGAVPMGYRGYARFKFQRGSWQTSRTMYFHHGSGGGAEMTFGTGKMRKRMAVIPDADIIVTGHLHQAATVPVTRCRLLRDGREIPETVRHVQLGTYKDDAVGHPHGWAIEKEMPPPSKEMAWLRFSLDRNEAIRLDTMPAVV